MAGDDVVSTALRGDRVTLECYGRTRRAEALAVPVDSLAALSGALGAAAAAGTKVTVRAGGNALDGQSITDAVALVLDGGDFKRLTVDTVRETVTVGAACTWGEIVEATVALGWIPCAVPSASSITAGGSLASHSISRFSPAYGKEGDHVVSFRVMLADGYVLDASPDAPDGSRERAAFEAVIGGLGYIGVVVEVTHRIMRVGEPKDVQLATWVDMMFEPDFAWPDLLNALQIDEAAPFAWLDALSDADRAALRSDPQQSRARPTVYASIWWEAITPRRRAALSRSWYTHGERPKPLLLYQRASATRFMVEFGLMSRFIGRVELDLFDLATRDRSLYIDPADDFLFFMDPNRKLLKWVPSARVIQQSFVLRSVSSAATFLEAVDALARYPENDFSPALVDVLYIPKDARRFALSATQASGGYEVTLTFLLPDGDKVGAIDNDLSDLARQCHGLGGVIHLPKHVSATRETVAAMYTKQLEEFHEAKKLLDPDGRFENDFYRQWIAPQADGAAE